MATTELDDLDNLRPATEHDFARIKWEDFIDAIDEAQVHKGALRVSGDFSVREGALIVAGDLEVGGTLSLDETGTLIVLGGLRCQNLYAEGNLEVQGRTAVTGVIFGFYEAGVTHLVGEVAAQVLLRGNHHFEVADSKLKLAHDFRFTNFSGLTTGAEPALRAVLSDAALDQLTDLIGLTRNANGDTDPAALLRAEGFLR